MYAAPIVRRTMVLGWCLLFGAACGSSTRSETDGGGPDSSTLPPDLPITNVHPGAVKDPVSTTPAPGSSPCGWLGPDDASAVTFTPDGTLLVTSGAGGLRFHDARTGAPVRAIIDAADVTGGISLSADGSLLAAGTGANGRVWRVRDGAAVFAVPDTIFANGPVALSPDGTRLAVGTNAADSNGVALFDVATGQQVRMLPFATPNIPAGLAFSPNGAYLAVGLSAGGLALELWSMQTFQSVAQRAGDLAFGALSFSPDSRLLAGGGLIVSVPSLDTYSGGALGLPVFSPDSTQLAVASEDTVVIQAVTASGLQPLRTITLPSPARAVAFAPGGANLAVAGRYTLSVRGLATDGVLWSWEGNTGTGSVVDHGFLSLNPHGQLRRWSARGELQGMTQIPATSSSPQDAEAPFVDWFGVSPDGARLAAAGSATGFSTVLLNQTGNPVSLEPSYVGGNFYPLPFAPAGDAMLSFRFEGSGATEIDAVTNTPLRQFPKRNPDGGQAVYSRDGKQVLVGGYPLDVWRRSDAKLLSRLAPDTPAFPVPFMESLALDAAGTTLASCDTAGMLRLWNTTSWSLPLAAPAHMQRCHVAFSPDGTRIVTSSEDSQIRVWRASDLALLTTLPGTSLGHVLGVATSTDGTDIAALQTAGGVYLYCLPTQ